ncbi:MAG: SCP-like extracellular, partial [Chloroflexi bacterium]|nr:SCP-like extracellular [Chloroflexota bacterium]
EGVNGSGQVSRIQPPIATNYAYYEPQTRHNVPAVLWNWMQNIPGSNWTFALGYPISEAYWSQFNVGGQNKMVLVQLFQRRVLTYTPSNSAAWQVEMGNIGSHYFNWRYNGNPPAPAQVASAPAQVASAPAQAASPLDSEEQTFINLVNDYRRAHGLGRLDYQPILQKAADWMSQDMAEKNYFSHTDSLGRDPFKRMAGFSYNGGWMGENIAAGKGTAGEVFNQFKGSPIHNANMLKPQYSKLGVARHHRPGSTYGWYWTLDFGDK